MQKALDKIASLELKLICPGHGPVLDGELDEIIRQYQVWNAAPTLENKLIVGYVFRLAKVLWRKGQRRVDGAFLFKPIVHAGKYAAVFGVMAGAAKRRRIWKIG